MMGLKLTRDLISPSVRRIQSELSKLPAQAYNFFVKATPKDTGNARRRTSLKNNQTIEARYPYAKRLDEGYSKQAPQGMSEPTGRFIEQRLRRIMRK